MASHVGRFSGQRMLVVEDVPDVRGAYATLLEIEGAVVTAASSGEHALELIRRWPFAVVVTDLGLPDMPGETLIRQIVSTARPRPFIVVITGHTDPLRRRASEAVVDVVLTKPIDWAALLRCLDGACGRAPAA